MWIYLNETMKSFHPHQNTDPFWNMFSRTTLNGDFIFENLNVFYLEVRQRIFKRSCSGFSTLVKQFVCAHEERGWRSFLFSVCNSFSWQTTKNGYEDMHTYSDYSSKINKSFKNMFFFHSRDYFTVKAVVSLFFWN